MKINIYGQKSQQQQEQIIQTDQETTELLTIDMNCMIDKVCILKKNEIYKNDLLLVLTQNIDIILLAFQSTGDVYNYQVIYNASLLDLDKKFQNKQELINHKMNSNIDVHNINDNNRLVVYNLYSNCKMTFDSIVIFKVILQRQIEVIPINYYVEENIHLTQDQIGFISFEKDQKLNTINLLAYFIHRNSIQQRTLNILKQSTYNQQQDQILIQKGQYELQNIPPYSIFQVYQDINNNYLLFILTIKTLYIYLQGQLQLKIDFQQYKRQISSRPVSIDILQINEIYRIMLAFDNASIINIDLCTDLQQCQIHKFEYNNIHLPTPFQILQYNNFLFVGSQTSQPQLIEVDYQNYEIKLSKIQLPLGLGSIQDLSFGKDNRMNIISGFGRDGQISQARLGLDLKYLTHQEIQHKNLLKANNLKFRSIFDQQTQYNFVINDTYVYKIENNQLIQQVEAEYEILDYDIVGNKQIIITNEFIQYGDQIIYFKIKSYKIYGHFITLQTQTSLLCFQILDQLKIIYEIKDFDGNYCMYQKQQQIYLLIYTQNIISQYQLVNNQFIKVFQKQITNFINIEQMEALIYHEQLLLIIQSKYSIYSVFIYEKDEQLDFQLIITRNEKIKLFRHQQGGDLFIKSNNSVYKLEIFDQQVYALPLLTEKLESLKYYSIMYIQRQYGVQQYQKYNIYSQQQKQCIEELLYDYILLVYKFEDENLIINYYDVSKYMNYKTYERYIKRTTVSLVQDQDTDSDIILTEQYLGKMQLRLIKQKNLEQVDKFIPYYTICTCLQPCYIDNQKYFGLSQFSSRDIFVDILHQEFSDIASQQCVQTNNIQPKIQFFYIKDDKLVLDQNKTIIFDTRLPITWFRQINEFVYVGIGNYLTKCNMQGTIIDQLQFDNIIEKFYNDNQYLYVVSAGMLYQVEQTNLNIKKQLTEIQDIKLIGCSEFLVLVTYCNELIILDKQFKIISRTTVNQTINCIQLYHNNIYLGCDTGSVLHFKFTKSLYLTQFQQQIIYAYQDTQRFLDIQKMNNCVDGDILSLYRNLPKNQQLSINKQLNISHDELIDLLFKLEFGE